jgi:hypothetical protein
MANSFLQRPRADTDENLFANEDGNPAIPLNFRDQEEESSDDEPSPFKKTI